MTVPLRSTAASTPQACRAGAWRLAGLVLLPLLLLLAPGGPAAAAGQIRLATWNIQTLTTGKPVFPPNEDGLPQYVRTPADIARLQRYARTLEADVVALQEVASPAAMAQLFPPAEWIICISGQFYEAYQGLGAPPAARCFDGGALPDTPASEDYAKQFVGLAVRRSARLRVEVGDVSALGVAHYDPRAQVERPTRWGLLATVKGAAGTLRLLNVHLKSGCFDDPPPRNPRKDASSNHCETLAKQVPVLDQYVRSTPTPFVLLGDFNRRLDLTRDEVFARLAGTDTRRDPTDDTGIVRFPERTPSRCLPEPRDTYEYVPIDYFLLSNGLEGTRFKEYSPAIPRGISPSAFKRAFGDHCAKSLVVRIP